MQVYCKFSGVSFLAQHFTNKMNIEAVHPIFYAEQRQLLNRARDWAAKRLNDTESKLLFLALLNSTKLVDFHATAKPEPRIVNLNMPTLLAFISWHSDIRSPQLQLPRFVISHDNSSMNNCHILMKAWMECKEEWNSNYASATLRKKLEKKEAGLERFIRSGLKSTEDYAGRLASWALVAANAPTSLHEYWTQLFKLKGIEVFNARTVDLEELVEHMEENLEVGNIFSFSVLKHVRYLLMRNRAGLGFHLGMGEEETEKLDYEALAANPFTIVEEPIETYNRELIASKAPAKEPVERDYPNKVAYLRAKAAFIIAQKQYEELEKKAKKEAAQMTDDALDVVHDDEIDEDFDVSSFVGKGGNND